MKLNKIIIVNGVMTAVEGIHIGGNNDGTKIGGCDNPVIRNPLTGDPYIPGTSIKGVMRSIMEKTMGKAESGKPCGCGNSNCIVCTMFGAHMNTKANSGEPRLMVRDMQLNKEFKDSLNEYGIGMGAVIETRTATMVDRKTNTAAGGSLRNFERVTAGAKFNCEFAIKVFDGDDEIKLVNALKKAITNIEHIGIGAKTTSGSGKVSFDINWDDVKVVKL